MLQKWFFFGRETNSSLQHMHNLLQKEISLSPQYFSISPFLKKIPDLIHLWKISVFLLPFGSRMVLDLLVKFQLVFVQLHFSCPTLSPCNVKQWGSVILWCGWYRSLAHPDESTRDVLGGQPREVTAFEYLRQGDIAVALHRQPGQAFASGPGGRFWDSTSLSRLPQAGPLPPSRGPNWKKFPWRLEQVFVILVFLPILSKKAKKKRELWQVLNQ